MDLQQKRIIMCIVLVIIVTIFFVQTTQPNQPEAIVVQSNTAEKPENSFSQPETNEMEIVVHIAGAVENPGVYTLLQGSRVEDAIIQAHLLPEADADALNRAAVLQDGQKIVVPFKSETHIINQEQTFTDGQIMEQTALINLNTANITRLMTLPGIGEVKAQAIIQYRQEHNGFQAIDELLLVTGIGTTIYSQIAELVCI